MVDVTGNDKGTVLIVEDDPVQMSILRAMLRKLGVASLAATTVAQARVLLKSPEIRTVMLDLQLGGEAGLDVLRSLEVGQTPHSLIFISGCDERTRAAAVRLADAQGVHVVGSLGKPVTLERVANLLETSPACAWRVLSKEGPEASVTDFVDALAMGHIVTEYQPKVSLVFGLPVGVEALARWRSPILGNIAPDIFIPLAEGAGYIRALTGVILETSLQACSRWRREFPNVSVAVNIAPSLVDQQLLDLVTSLLEETGVPAGSLILEITESSAVADSVSVSNVLTRLRIKGVQLSIDDFGTGHSTLVSLLKMPFSELKLDRLFVASSSADPDADRILRSLVHLARDMGLRTVAEGIETNEVRNRLQDYGCEVGQGWLWAPALKEDALKAWMDRMTPRSTSISDPKTQLPYVSNQEAATS